MGVDLGVSRGDVAEFEQCDDAPAAAFAREPVVVGAPGELEHLVGDLQPFRCVLRAPERGVARVQCVRDRCGVSQAPRDRYCLVDQGRAPLRRACEVQLHRQSCQQARTRAVFVWAERGQSLLE